MLTRGALLSLSSPNESDDSDISPEQQKLLCKIGMVGATNEWKDKRDDITFDLRDSLPNAEKQLKDAQSQANKYSDILKLNDGDRQRLSREYTDMRLDRFAQLRSFIEQEPADYKSAFAWARRYLREEDKLIENLFGAQAAKDIADSEYEGRMKLLTNCPLGPA